MSRTDELRRCRRFVRIGDPGEMRYLARASFSVQTFWIPLLADLEWSRDVDFDEGTASLSPHLVARCMIRRNRAYENDDAVPRQEVGDEADAPDILVAILSTETELPAEVLAHRITVKQLGSDSARGKFLTDAARDGRFSCAAEARKPDSRTATRLMNCRNPECPVKSNQPGQFHLPLPQNAELYTFTINLGSSFTDGLCTYRQLSGVP